MKLKVGMAAIFLSLSVLLLQSYSFSTAKIKSDVSLTVSSEHDALISITNWEGRIFTVINNTASTVNIDSITIMGDESLGVDGYFYSMLAGEARVFSLIGEAPKLSGKQILLIVSWDGGSAEITSWIPLIVEKVNVLTVNACTDQTDEVNNEVDLDSVEVAADKEVDLATVEVVANEERDTDAFVVELSDEVANMDTVAVDLNEEVEMDAEIVEANDEVAVMDEIVVESNESAVDAVIVETNGEVSDIGKVVVESNVATADMEELVVGAKKKTTEMSTVVVAVDGGCLGQSEEVDEKIVEELLEEMEDEKTENEAEEAVQFDEEEGTEEKDQPEAIEEEAIEETEKPEADNEEKNEGTIEDVEAVIEDSMDEETDQTKADLVETEQTETEE